MNDLYNLSNDTINEAYSAAFSYGYNHDLEAESVADHINVLIRETADRVMVIVSRHNDPFYNQICKIVKNHYLPRSLQLRSKLIRKESALQAAHHHQLIFKEEQTK